MSVYEHSRSRIISPLQHPLKHVLSDFVFAHNALPANVTSLDQALEWLFDAVYPKTKAPVATIAALPVVGNTLGDQRVVNDDGDGRAAVYKWSQYDGEATPSWHKTMDVDWSTDTILAKMVDQTQPLFMLKQGADDYDEAGVIISGLLAGQSLYGGESANANLTLFANNGDVLGNTGFIQLGDNTSPLTDSSFSLGENLRRFLNIYTDEINSGTLQITGGSIKDSSGSISFDNENLSTSGTLASGTATISSDMVVSTGSITSASGAIGFDNENLSTTGTLASGTHTVSSDMEISTGKITSVSGAITFDNENLSTTGTLGAGDTTVSSLNVDLLKVDNNEITTVSGNQDITMAPHGTGKVLVTKTLDTKDIDTIGNVDVTGNIDASGSVSAGNLTLDTNTLSSTSNIILNAGALSIFLSTDTKSTIDAATILGDATHRFKDLYMSGAIHNGTDYILMADLLALRSNIYRDTGRTLPAQSGDTLFYNGTQWLSSAPDTEIDHGSISGLSDDDHTQYALLAGRVGGQTINGGSATTNKLLLRNNSVDANGLDIGSVNILPTGDGLQDLGSATKKFKDLYMGGELIGSRAQNLLETNISALTSASTKGRLFYATDTQSVWVDVGGAKKKVGSNTYKATHTDVVLNGGAVNVTSGTDITDARDCIWQLKDLQNNQEIMFVTITSVDANTITVVASPPLPAGNYKLLGVQV